MSSASNKTLITVWQSLLNDSTDPLSNALRERLADVNLDTGKTKAEELLEITEREASKGTKVGRQIAKLLPDARRLVASIKAGRRQ